MVGISRAYPVSRSRTPLITRSGSGGSPGWSRPDISAFVNRMARTERGRGVAVRVYSEFGRRVRANASDGTDHGTAPGLLGTS